ncbi:MAG: LPS assembly protein LptD [Gammaproteobacteria bacterium]|nr:LPS assembly protein LptD [Gammaproteobacteria bacterium]
MNKSYSLSLLLLPSLFSANIFAAPECELPTNVISKNTPSNVLERKKSLVPQTNEVVVTSDKADLIRSQYAEFSGNVTIFQQEQTIKADSAIFSQEKQQFNAKGNVELNSKAALVTGESILVDDRNKNFELVNARYQFGFNAGRGKANTFAIQNNNKLLLDGATFTTCPGDDPSWLFSSGDIYINQEKGWGEAWNTTFNIGNVPIMWIPYITFPITDERKSGLLFPSFGSSTRHGVYYSQPIYFSLATNYDFTFTPEYMSERGWLWKTNYRHLSENSYNELQLEYMAKDSDNRELNERYLAYWQHESDWSDNWAVTTQLTSLGDDNYISEFDSEYHHKADTNLNNFVAVNYYGENIDASFLSQHIQELGPQQASYRIPAQIGVNWRDSDNLALFKSNLFGQYTLFTHDEFDVDQVQRLHIEPQFTFDYKTPAYQLLASTSYLSTFYDQKNRLTQESTQVSRNIFKHRILAGLNFEKQTEYFDANVRQTLEPKIQYLYVQDADQTNIGLYESQRLKEDYFSLFRDTVYSGLDRISPMNQATIGFSSSIFNSKNQELFRLGVAQIFKFENFDGTNEQDTRSNSSFAVEWFGQLSENWQMDGAMLYNSENDTVESGFLSFDYWLTKDKNFQINHRYADDLAGFRINQTGLFSSYQISPQWSVAASYHYNFETDVNLDSLIGIEYRSCCWSVQFAAQRQVVIDLNEVQFDDQKAVQYDNGISLNFKISGMGGDISSSIADLFSDSIFAYRRPYLITN